MSSALENCKNSAIKLPIESPIYLDLLMYLTLFVLGCGFVIKNALFKE